MSEKNKDRNDIEIDHDSNEIEAMRVKPSFIKKHKVKAIILAILALAAVSAFILTWHYCKTTKDDDGKKGKESKAPSQEATTSPSVTGQSTEAQKSKTNDDPLGKLSSSPASQQSTTTSVATESRSPSKQSIKKGDPLGIPPSSTVVNARIEQAKTQIREEVVDDQIREAIRKGKERSVKQVSNDVIVFIEGRAIMKVPVNEWTEEDVEQLRSVLWCGINVVKFEMSLEEQKDEVLGTTALVRDYDSSIDAGQCNFVVSVKMLLKEKGHWWEHRMWFMKESAAILFRDEILERYK